MASGDEHGGPGPLPPPEADGGAPPPEGAAEVLPPQPPSPPPPGDGRGDGRRRRRQLFEDRPMSVTEHLEELRRRLLWMIGALLGGVTVSFSFVYPLLRFLERPLHGFRLNFTGPLDPLFAVVKIAVACGLILASPVLIYQAVAYVLPALTARERRLLFSYLPAALLLFLGGMAFGFFVFIPLVIAAMFRFAGNTLTPLLTINAYISFLLSFTLPFGAIFELPVVVVVLVKLDVLTPQTLAAGRRWALMTTVVLAAIFAPPDPITPLVMAAPMYALYEVSIWIARLAHRRGRVSD
jgi:sec-independent protein translocase protein TatC